VLVAQYSQHGFEPDPAGPFNDSASGEVSNGYGSGDVPPAPPPDVLPQGEVYDWYTRGLALLEAGDAGAAMNLIGHAAQAEPDSRSVREALARAQFDVGLYEEAVQNFGWIVSVNPADDYAQFGMGLAAAKVGDLAAAVEHLALAAAMRPDISHYSTALRGARSALASARR